MTMREKAVQKKLPSLGAIGNIAEFSALGCAMILVLLLALFGGAGIVLGFSMELITMFGKVALGILLIGVSFLIFSLLIGLIEGTYYDDEGAIAEMSEEQDGGHDKETIGRRREPEEYKV